MSFKSVKKDLYLNVLRDNSILKLPCYNKLSAAKNNSGKEGNIVLDRATRLLYYHNGLRWVAVGSSSPTPSSYSDSTAITGPGSGNPTWSVTGYVQKIGNVGQLNLQARRTLPILAQNSWVATLPVGFYPTQNLTGIPIVTNDVKPTLNVQAGTIDISTTGHVENINITLDGSSGEFFDLNVLLPL